MFAVHKVADKNEEHDEDVEMYEGHQEEVVGQEQECLRPVPALDGADDTCCFDGGDCVCGPLEPDSMLEDGHIATLYSRSVPLEKLSLYGSKEWVVLWDGRCLIDSAKLRRPRLEEHDSFDKLPPCNAREPQPP